MQPFSHDVKLLFNLKPPEVFISKDPLDNTKLLKEVESKTLLSDFSDLTKEKDIFVQPFSIHQFKKRKQKSYIKNFPVHAKKQKFLKKCIQKKLNKVKDCNNLAFDICDGSFKLNIPPSSPALSIDSGIDMSLDCNSMDTKISDTDSEIYVSEFMNEKKDKRQDSDLSALECSEIINLPTKIQRIFLDENSRVVDNPLGDTFMACLPPFEVSKHRCSADTKMNSKPSLPIRKINVTNQSSNGITSMESLNSSIACNVYQETKENLTGQSKELSKKCVPLIKKKVHFNKERFSMIHTEKHSHSAEKNLVNFNNNDDCVKINTSTTEFQTVFVRRPNLKNLRNEFVNYFPSKSVIMSTDEIPIILLQSDTSHSNQESSCSNSMKEDMACAKDIPNMVLLNKDNSTGTCPCSSSSVFDFSSNTSAKSADEKINIVAYPVANNMAIRTRKFIVHDDKSIPLSLVQMKSKNQVPILKAFSNILVDSSNIHTQQTPSTTFVLDILKLTCEGMLQKGNDTDRTFSDKSSIASLYENKDILDSFVNFRKPHGFLQKSTK